MRRAIMSVALLAFLCPAEARAAGAWQGPRLLDEFGDILATDWLARADNLAVELQNMPGTKAFIVAYGVPNKLPGWPLRRANWAKGVLVNGRGIDSARVEVVYGGYRDSVLYQHWIAGAGSPSPVPAFDFAAALVREKSAFQFDQFYVFDPPTDYGYDGQYNSYLDDRGRYEPLALALRHDPAARACIIAYAARHNRRGADKQLAANVKMSVVTSHAIGVDRLVALGGGLREHTTVELWIVPPGSPLPKPTPTARPTRRRRR